MSKLNDTAIEIINKNTNNKTKTIMSGKFTFLGIMLAMMSFSMNINADNKQLILDGSADTNYKSICKADGDVCDVTIIRSFKANTWSSFVLPFELNEEMINEVFGEDANLCIMKGYDGTQVSFSNVKSINPNVPFMILLTKAVADPVFKNVEVIAPNQEQPYSTTGSDFTAKFIGNYGGRLMLGTEAFYYSKNTFYKSGGHTPCDSFRGYFTFSNIDGTKTFYIDKNQAVTGIKDINENSLNNKQSTYNLNGLRVNSDYKGIVIIGGKKFIK